MSNISLRKQPHKDPAWKGYTIDELRYQRAYTAARIEIARHGLQRSVADMMTATSQSATPTGILGKIFNSLSYIDIGIIAFKTGRKLFNAIKKLRR